ncbi:hypothetical protein AWJ20_2068 [Sugiyamaella lignohabitans]|uniref:Uncharacterized protein n=1 Tax=Sugiyamaella lignohabitans TaxID=796027 RepID=A0A167EUK2_9ASCO|nr:uncharacterized protein AWJ20_2068 [Sugiyamaella lignohabitans]ANB14476.1 hypothetical protein AWJ20_2068 [Sugiyamaella lignohabitans]
MLAPTTDSTLTPFLKNNKVGMAEISFSEATSGTASTSTLKKWAEGVASEILSRTGEIILQGPHQVA